MEAENSDFLLVLSSRWCVLKKRERKNKKKEKGEGLVLDLGDAINLELVRGSIIKDFLTIGSLKWWV